MYIPIVWEKTRGKTILAKVGQYKLAVRPIYRSGTRTLVHYTSCVDKLVDGVNLYSCIDCVTHPNARAAKTYVVNKLKSILEGGV